MDTTHIYAEVDLEMKAKALAKVDISGLKESPRQRSLPSLMAFLKDLLSPVYAACGEMREIGCLHGKHWCCECTKVMHQVGVKL
ncbi:hypothetical protein [Sinorhizobium meliloti]|uniref:hypothetical protein n=1 Tax=Rhizobium meliloti TaxID=382 RepID=UPI001F173057|nr:hypothetical protein [Sinorhizobium meliloti]